MLLSNPDGLLLVLLLDILSSLPLVTRSVSEEEELVLDTERVFILSESVSDCSLSMTVSSAIKGKTVT